MTNRHNRLFNLPIAGKVAEAESNGSLRKGSDGPVSGGCAVESGPAEDPKLLFQQRCNLRWREVFNIKREGCNSVFHLSGTVKSDLRNIFKTFDQFFDQMAFVSANRFNPSFQNKPDAGKKSGDANSIGRSALKT